jgi:hypothetical protein
MKVALSTHVSHITYPIPSTTMPKLAVQWTMEPAPLSAHFAPAKVSQKANARRLGRPPVNTTTDRSAYNHKSTTLPSSRPRRFRSQGSGQSPSETELERHTRRVDRCVLCFTVTPSERILLNEWYLQYGVGACARNLNIGNESPLCTRTITLSPSDSSFLLYLVPTLSVCRKMSHILQSPQK